jgi:hypothetical protein
MRLPGENYDIGFPIPNSKPAASTKAIEQGSTFTLPFSVTCNDALHHIAMTYNGLNNGAAGLLLYIDGVSVAGTVALNQTLSATITSTANFQISGRAGADSLAGGLIDDIQIYNCALPPSDILRVMGMLHPLCRV